jgi:hypothetical protein
MLQRIMVALDGSRLAEQTLSTAATRLGYARTAASTRMPRHGSASRTQPWETETRPRSSSAYSTRSSMQARRSRRAPTGWSPM